MRRLLLGLTVALVMAVMLALGAGPAMAGPPNLLPNAHPHYLEPGVCTAHEGGFRGLDGGTSNSKGHANGGNTGHADDQIPGESKC
jgi:hypothetical protein